MISFRIQVSILLRCNVVLVFRFKVVILFWMMISLRSKGVFLFVIRM